MKNCVVTLYEERHPNTYDFQMFVPRHNAEHTQSWVHEFTEMGVYFALIDMDIDHGDLAHTLACITCGANNNLTGEHVSGDRVWRNRKIINFRRDAVL